MKMSRDTWLGATPAERLELHREKMWNKRARSTAPREGGEQLGHSPNRATVREHHRDHLGNVTRHWVTVRTKHAGLPRNSIWPEGKVAKPGRMG